MSYIIKLVNEDNNKKYTNYEAVSQLIYYIMNVLKTNYDTKRPGHAIGDFNGCIPFLGPEYMAHEPYEVDCLMQLHLKVLSNGKKPMNLIEHRIISFHKSDYILPSDGVNVAKCIISRLYNQYLCVFGVHLDTEQIHVHLGVSSYSILTGNRFDIPYEYNKLDDIVHDWYDRHLDYLECIPGIKERYERYLFDDKVRV